MPICPKCGIAYLDSEKHTCPPRRTARERGVLAAYVVGGASLGTLAVTILIAAVAVDPHVMEYSMSLGSFFGAAPGGWAGYVIGARTLSRKRRETSLE